MNDPSNPSYSEIKAWAYSEEAWPDQSWDLFLSWKQEIEIFIQFATDYKCPKQGFFRYMLYFQVGKAMSGSFGEDSSFVIQGYVEKAKGINHGEIRKWVKETQWLLENPSSYNHEKWIGGSLANYHFT